MTRDAHSLAKSAWETKGAASGLQQSVYVRIWMDGYFEAYSPARGEKCMHAKLTNDQAIEIYRRVKAGERQSKVAREFGLSRNAVNRMMHGKSWTRILDQAGLLITP